jgi:ABC-type transport system involved in multi-copper enzyme maturation permease subunit
VSLRDLDARHLRIVSLYTARNAVRGGTGLVFAVVTLFFGLTVGHLLISSVEMGEKVVRQGLERGGGQAPPMSREQIIQGFVDVARPAVEWAIEGRFPEPSSDGPGWRLKQSSRWTSYLVDEQPALLSAVWLILIFGLPFLVGLGAFNQFSGDVQTRGIRYQLLRTDRSNIFFGRFLATLAFSLLVLAAVVLTIGLYVGLKLEVYKGSAVAGWSLRGFLALAVIAMPYVALCSWISAHVDSPFGSLTICNLVVGIVPFLSFIGRNSWEPLAKINYALPWPFHNDLLHPDAARVAGAAGACLGYTAVFLALGYLRFSRRDL